MIKVLGLALYGPLAASTRYRLGQYVPGLALQGIDLHIVHLLGDDYLLRRFTGRSLPITAMVQAGFARFVDLLGQHRYDLVMVYCELFPLFPAWLERALIRKPYIYDFDDAFYLKYRLGRLGMARTFLGRKFESVMAGAAAVTAGNNLLAQYSRQFKSNTFYLPTVVDTSRYVSHMSDRSDKVFTVGWIGSPSTAQYLSLLVEPLSAIGLDGPVQFIVIGGKAPVIPNVSVVEIEWNEDTEVDLINSFDVGVMPLPDDDWAQGKCAFKLIQYMACAVPVVASPVGANSDVITAESGCMASTSEEWIDKLRLLRDSPDIRVSMGQASMKRIVEYYSLSSNLPILADVIHQVAEKK